MIADVKLRRGHFPFFFFFCVPSLNWWEICHNVYHDWSCIGQHEARRTVTLSALPFLTIATASEFVAGWQQPAGLCYDVNSSEGFAGIRWSADENVVRIFILQPSAADLEAKHWPVCVSSPCVTRFFWFACGSWVKSWWISLQKRFVWLRSNVKEEIDCKVWLHLPSKQLTMPVQLYFFNEEMSAGHGPVYDCWPRQKYHGFYHCIVMYMSKM